MPSSTWPALPTTEWTPTLAFLHRCTQILGKARLVNDSWLNHSWSVALYLTPSGLRTGLVPHGDRGFEMSLELTTGRLAIETTHGLRWSLDTADRSVADVFASTTEAMDRLGLECHLNPIPSEIPDVRRSTRNTTWSGSTSVTPVPSSVRGTTPSASWTASAPASWARPAPSTSSGGASTSR